MVQTVERLADRHPLYYQRSNYRTSDDGELADATNSPKFFWVLLP